MNADQARKITSESINGPVIQKYIKAIEARIEREAKKGKRSIHDPNIGSPQSGFQYILSSVEEKAVQRYFEGNGFVWTYHPDPDPGHPCSSSYVTLSW